MITSDKTKTMRDCEIVNGTGPEFAGEAEFVLGLPAHSPQFQQCCRRQDQAPYVLQVFVADAKRVNHGLRIRCMPAVFLIEPQAEDWNCTRAADTLPVLGSPFH